MKEALEELLIKRGKNPLDVSSYLASQNICRRMNAVYWNQIDEGNLIKCQLGNTGITSLRKGDFQGLDNLPSPYEIYLRNNDLSSLPEGIFQGLNNLQSLSLGVNNLTCLPSLPDSLKEIRLGDLKSIHNPNNHNLPPCKPSKPFDETELSMGFLDSAPYAAVGSSPPRASP